MSKARNTGAGRRQKPSKTSREKPESPVREEPLVAAHDEPESIEYTPMSGCLCRIYWLLLGNVFLGLTTYSIANTHDRIVGGMDALYWLLVVSMIATRYVDVRYLKGVTTDAELATMQDWRRYSLQLALVSAGLWLAAHAYAYFAS